MIERPRDIKIVRDMLSVFPVTAVLGARQCGKTTLSRAIGGDHYFDLENPRDEARFMNPQLLLEDLKGLIVIDEIQRKPDLFPLLRYLVDTISDQRYLILGSASRNLLSHGSESLAGRIGFHSLGGFHLNDTGDGSMKKLWIRGGFPRSYLSASDDQSTMWRNSYITTYLERDIPQLGIRIPSATLRRFWMMLAHYNAQILNFSEIGRAFGISDMTVRSYLEILESTFMIRILQPYYTNISKRLVKRPKLYFRDSGIFHTLMAIESLTQLTAHPRLGASWESFALEETLAVLDKSTKEVFFWATHSGAEVDLVYQSKGSLQGVEFKYCDAPLLTKSMRSAMESLDLKQLIVVYPGKESYRLNEKARVVPVTQLKNELI